jgi:DNA-directed RNA polymerase subunit alpha
MQRNWSSLIRPKRIDVDEATHTNNYGEFVIQPLERGYGITLGNALFYTGFGYCFSEG